jgi:hypothetical protein
MSVIPLKADIHQRGLHVRYVPEADIRENTCADPIDVKLLLALLGRAKLSAQALRLRGAI